MAPTPQSSLPANVTLTPPGQSTTAPTTQGPQPQSSSSLPDNVTLTPPPSGSTIGPAPLSGENASGVMGLGVGVAKGAARTVQGVEKLANQYVLPDSHQIPIVNEQSTKSSNMAQGAGGLIENAAEFLAGDEALKALSEFANVAKYSQTAAGWTKYLTQNPTALKAAEAIGRIARYGSVGTTQGAVAGAEQGDTAEGAKTGAEGAVIGAGAGEVLAKALPAAVTAVAKRFGINRAPVEELTKALAPGKWNTDFGKDFLKVSQELGEQNKIEPPKNMTQLADNAKTAMQKLWTGDIHDVIDAHSNDPISTMSIGTNLTADAQDPFMRTHSPEGVKNYMEEAQKWNQLSQSNVGDMEKHIEHLNAKLNDEGWWDRTARERQDATKVGDKTGVTAEAARYARNFLYNHLENNGAPEIRELKEKYGALANIENVARGRANVVDRQVPMSLKEMLGLTAAAAAGPKGWVAAALPYLDQYINNPTRMAVRAINNQVNPTATLASKAVQAVTSTAPKLGKLGALVGEEAGSPSTSEPTQ